MDVDVNVVVVVIVVGIEGCNKRLLLDRVDKIRGRRKEDQSPPKNGYRGEDEED